jgi:hypothetical protein
MDGVYVTLGTRAGLFGSVGLLDERSRTRLAEAALDAARARSPQDEDHVALPPECARAEGEHPSNGG